MASRVASTDLSAAGDSERSIRVLSLAARDLETLAKRFSLSLAEQYLKVNARLFELALEQVDERTLRAAERAAGLSPDEANVTTLLNRPADATDRTLEALASVLIDIASQVDVKGMRVEMSPVENWFEIEPSINPPIRRMADISAEQFGVSSGGRALGPYVDRDVDAELRQAVSAGPPIVAVVAEPGAGATRSIYEALRAVRPDARVLDLTHVSDEDNALFPVGSTDILWVRDLARLGMETVAASVTLLRPGARVVGIINPADEQLFATISAPVGVVVLTAELSAAERRQAAALYPTVEARMIADLTADRSAARGVRANYGADGFVAALLNERTDALRIRRDVDVLAALIASKDVTPPLSIGLFGKWGSGKSFFMHQLKLRVADLAARSRAVGDEGTTFHAEIVSIDFNAWQYAHGDLWASLLNRVFEGIRENLDHDDRYLDGLAALTDQADEVARAKAEANAARAVLDVTARPSPERTVGEVADRNGLTDAAAALHDALGDQIDLARVDELAGEVAELHTLGGKLRGGWAAQRGTHWRWFVMVLALLGLGALSVVMLVPVAARAVVVIAGIAVPVAGSLVAILRPVNHILGAADTLLGADRRERRDYAAAQQRLADAEAALNRLRRQAPNDFYGFVADRGTAQEYQAHLGTAPLVRRDLRELARRAAETESWPGIDRVVVFIDDLDRCAAADVVRVLEAVNLLFGFELFVVVVAVDSRWLVRSLTDQFGAVFDGHADAPTPRDYLEKIIQIPFWLRPMADDGFARLVDDIVGVGGVRSSVLDASDGPSPEEAKPGTEVLSGPSPTIEAATVAREAAAASAETQQDPELLAPLDLSPQALQITAEELEFVRRLAPLVRTPRATKRFLNTYQLVRIAVDDVEEFLRTREYEPVLLLLAMLVGTAALNDAQAGRLRDMSTGNARVLLNTGGEWATLNTCCELLPAERITPQLIDKWLPRVARYSFHPTLIGDQATSPG